MCKHLKVRPIVAYEARIRQCFKCPRRRQELKPTYCYDYARICAYGELLRLTQARGDPKFMGVNLNWLTRVLGESRLPHWRSEDPKWRTVQIQHWSGLHFRLAAAHSLQVLRVTVSGKGTTQNSPKSMWLGWIGDEMLSLEHTWRCYLRRFAVDHWNRFAKQRLLLATTALQYN